MSIEQRPGRRFEKGQEVRWTLPGQATQEGCGTYVKGRIQRGEPDEYGRWPVDFPGGYCTKWIPERELEVQQ